MAKTQPDNAEDAIKEIRRLLADWLDKAEESRRPVAQIMRLLEVVDEDLKQRAVKKPGRAKTLPRDEPRYTVENTASGPMLTEGKSGEKSPPFRVPKAIYDLVAEVLAVSSKPIRFEDILAEVSQKAVAAPSDFQVRVCLRYWMSVDPPLIVRAKSMYHPVSQTKFISLTQDHWQSTLIGTGSPDANA